MTQENEDTTLNEVAVKAQLESQIQDGLRAIKKQCKQLSKNQLIDTLLQQLERVAELQNVAQYLFEENKKLKESEKKDENANS